MGSLSQDERRNLNKPRLCIPDGMSPDVFKGLGLHSTRFVFDKEISLRRTPKRNLKAHKRMSLGAVGDSRRNSLSPDLEIWHSRRKSLPPPLAPTPATDTSWRAPAGDSKAAGKRLSKFIGSFSQPLTGRPASVPLPAPPGTQHNRNPFYKSLYGREAGESNNRLQFSAGRYGDDLGAQEDDPLEEARRKAAAEAAKEIGAHRRKAEAALALKRLQEQREREQKSERALVAKAELEEFEQRLVAVHG